MNQSSLTTTQQQSSTPTSTTSRSETRDMLKNLASHLDTPDIVDTERVTACFDVSPYRLWLLFQAVDSNRDGFISQEELVEFLVLVAAEDEEGRIASESNLDKPALQQLWNMLVTTNTTCDDTSTEKPKHRQGISFLQFSHLIRHLWLQQLLKAELDLDGIDPSTAEYTFDCIDYGASSYFERKRVPGHITDESRHFYNVPRHPQAKMRWIDVPSGGLSRITILRLSVMYRFHPTSVEDAIDLELQAPDIDSFQNSLLDIGDYSMDSGGRNDENDRVYEEADIIKGDGLHYFIAMPMFELTERSQRTLDQSLNLDDKNDPPQSKGSWSFFFQAAGQLPSEPPPLTIEIKKATLGIFVASQPDPNIVVTVSTKWTSTRIKPLFPTQEGISSSGSDEEEQEVSQEAFATTKTTTVASLERVKRLLQKRHSIQRHGTSDWLLHAILDAIVDNLKPISNMYETKLKVLSTRLLELGHRLSTREVKEIIIMKRDLEWLKHELRPMLIVLRHLIDDKHISVEVTHYLEDIEDHFNLLIVELSYYAQESEAMRAQFNSYSDRRMNDILYLLTLVTTLFVPPQFFTGYFGMNFVDNDTGEAGSPLLNQGWKGVVSFWIIVMSTTAIVALVMYHYRWFEKPREV